MPPITVPQLVLGGPGQVRCLGAVVTCTGGLFGTALSSFYLVKLIPGEGTGTLQHPRGSASLTRGHSSQCVCTCQAGRQGARAAGRSKAQEVRGRTWLHGSRSSVTLPQSWCFTYVSHSIQSVPTRCCDSWVKRYLPCGPPAEGGWGWGHKGMAVARGAPATIGPCGNTGSWLHLLQQLVPYGPVRPFF